MPFGMLTFVEQALRTASRPPGPRDTVLSDKPSSVYRKVNSTPILLQLQSKVLPRLLKQDNIFVVSVALTG